MKIYLEKFIKLLENIITSFVKEPHQTINTLIQIFLGIIAIIGIFFFVFKLIDRNTEFTIISYYGSLDKDYKLDLVFKLKTDSATDLVIEEIKIFADTNYDSKELIPFSLRWKGFLPKMFDNNRKESDYALNGPLYPNLIMDGIKSGINQYYISLKSLEKDLKPDLRIDRLNITITSKVPSIIAPTWLTRKTQTIKVDMPEEKDRYFDDSLIRKISNNERQEIEQSL